MSTSTADEEAQDAHRASTRSRGGHADRARPEQLTDFEAFAVDAGTRLRRALVAQHGVEAGVEAAADALGYAWEHWDELRVMANPVGYLYRVAQSSTRRYRRWRTVPDLPPEDRGTVPDAVLDLPAALGQLTERQRTVVLLVHAYGWSYGDVAEVLGISHGSVRNQLHRGTKRLRRILEADHGS